MNVRSAIASPTPRDKLRESEVDTVARTFANKGHGDDSTRAETGSIRVLSNTEEKEKFTHARVAGRRAETYRKRCAANGCHRNDGKRAEVSRIRV
jgi:hypothetical protein